MPQPHRPHDPAHPNEHHPLTPLATRIDTHVLQAMQSAEELGGPAGEYYLNLMSVIETKARTRTAGYTDPPLDVADNLTLHPKDTPPHPALTRHTHSSL